MTTRAEIERRFNYDAAMASQKDRMALLRTTFIDLAMKVVVNVPDGRERSLALTKLEEASMHAMSGIAREAV